MQRNLPAANAPEIEDPCKHTKLSHFYHSTSSFPYTKCLRKFNVFWLSMELYYCNLGQLTTCKKYSFNSAETIWQLGSKVTKLQVYKKNI